MNRLGNLIRRTRGALFPRAFGALAGLSLATVANAAVVSWTNNQSPECTIGDGSTAATAKSFNCVDAVAIDAVNRKCYITDRENHRVLRFAYPVTTNQPSAEAVFGQADFTSKLANRGGAAAANTLNMPYGLAVASNGDLWISDYDNHRIVKIPSAHTAANGAAATIVLGQANLTASAQVISANGLIHPTGLSIDSSNNLWVADMGNSRVLRFANILSASTGTSAAQVFGQTGFNYGSANRGGNAASNTLNSPYAVGASGTTLWIVDSQNHRVLRFNNATGKGNGAAADAVLGQADFTSTTANRGGSMGANTLNCPAGVALDDSGELLVADCFNYRLLVFAGATSFTNGAAATTSFNASPWNIAYDSTYHRLLAARMGGNTAAQYANLAVSSTALTTSNSSSFPETPVTFTATVTSAAGTPSGTVQFVDTFNSVSTVLSTVTLNASGVATFSTAALARGNHTITAKYQVSALYLCSEASVSQAIELAAPGFTFAPSANGAKVGTLVTFTAQLAKGTNVAALPTGSVAFTVDGTDQATVTIDATGKATWSSTGLALGTHVVKAAYSGDTTYRPVAQTFTQYIDPPELRSIPIVANLERDASASTAYFYNDSDYGGILYAGFYDVYSCWTALRFDVNAASSSFVSAKLKVRIDSKTNNTSTAALELHGSNDRTNWPDVIVPPATTPGFPSDIIATPITSIAANTFTAGDWLTFDVTGFLRTRIADNKIASFVFTMPSLTTEWYLGIYSRATYATPPVLQILEKYTYASWAETYFSPAELANSAIGGATADPDGSGFTNLLRYALGLPAHGPVVSPVATTISGTTATVAFPLPANRLGVSYVVQSSPDLATWTDVQTYTSADTVQNISRSITLPTGAMRYFFRLKVVGTP